MLKRIVNVLRLDENVFEEIKNEPRLISQGVIILVFVAALTILGNFLSGRYNLFAPITWVFVIWFLWSVTIYLMGHFLFKGEADLGTILRVMSFVYAPQVLGIIPVIGGSLGILWSLVIGFVGISRVMAIKKNEAILTVLVGLIIGLIGLFIVAGVIGSLVRIFS